MTKKAYVLDTNVLIHDPQSIFQFQDNDIYIPIYVIEELDKLKSEPSIRGKNSRESCRILDELRCRGNLAAGVDLNDDGGKLTVYVPTERKSIAVGLDAKSMDNVILQCALELRDKITDIRTILVTMDVNLRIRSECLGLQTAPYESQSVNPDQLSTGITEIDVESGDIDHMYANKSIGVDDPTMFANACVMMKEPSGKTALGRYHKSKNEIRPLIANMDVMGIRPKNREQQFAFDLLLDDSVKLVTILGIAGCGKAQPLESPVLTPNGWVPMGTINVGDLVSTPDGKSASVIGVFPQGEKEIVRVCFSDGTSTECCKEHLWETKTSIERDLHKQYKVRSTDEISQSIMYRAIDALQHFIIRITTPIRSSKLSQFKYF